MIFPRAPEPDPALMHTSPRCAGARRTHGPAQAVPATPVASEGLKPADALAHGPGPACLLHIPRQNRFSSGDFHGNSEEEDTRQARGGRSHGGESLPTLTHIAGCPWSSICPSGGLPMLLIVQIKAQRQRNLVLVVVKCGRCLSGCSVRHGRACCDRVLTVLRHCCRCSGQACSPAPASEPLCRCGNRAWRRANA